MQRHPKALARLLAIIALVAAIVALAAGAFLYATLRIRGRLGAWILLLQGAIYAAYVAYLIPRL
jgi:hypothetical protein